MLVYKLYNKLNNYKHLYKKRSLTVMIYFKNLIFDKV